MSFWAKPSCESKELFKVNCLIVCFNPTQTIPKESGNAHRKRENGVSSLPHASPWCVALV